MIKYLITLFKTLLKMAKDAFINVTPTSGNGNGTLQVSAGVYDGRVKRDGKFSVVSGSISKDVAVSQNPAAEFVSIDESSYNVGKAGDTLIITGRSNSLRLNFAIVDPGTGGAWRPTLPATYQVEAVSVNNGAAIPGDPGATAGYVWSISIEIPKNPLVDARNCTLSVTTTNAQVASATISQAAGDTILELSTTSITLEADGTAKTVSVSSNTTWSVQ